jgi:hypothetical protein
MCGAPEDGVLCPVLSRVRVVGMACVCVCVRVCVRVRERERCALRSTSAVRQTSPRESRPLRARAEVWPRSSAVCAPDRRTCAARAPSADAAPVCTLSPSGLSCGAQCSGAPSPRLASCVLLPRVLAVRLTGVHCVAACCVRACVCANRISVKLQMRDREKSFQRASAGASLIERSGWRGRRQNGQASARHRPSVTAKTPRLARAKASDWRHR